MATLHELHNELDELDSILDELATKRGKLIQSIQEATSEQFSITNSILQVGPGKYYICVNKSQDYHFTLLELYNITTENKAIKGTYRLDDYEYSYRCVCISKTPSLFHNLKEEFDIYNVPEETFNKVNYLCTKLEINTHSLDNLRESFKELNMPSIRI